MLDSAQNPSPIQVSPQSLWSKRWQRFKNATPVLKSLFTIFLLFGLDIRDTVYKLVWIGSNDSYNFHMGSTVRLQDVPITPAITALDNVTLTSGWPSFLSLCDSITPFCSPGSTFFLSAVLSNCRLNDATENSSKASSIVVIADTRADAVAWASCSLLFVARRPPICQEDIVANFNQRYVFSAPDVPRDVMAPVDSPAELELLRLLDLLSFSVPMYGVVCAEGFQVDLESVGSGANGPQYVPNIFVCGSPSQHRSEFVGVENPAVYSLLRGKAWLTMDVLQWMSIHWSIRQNTHSYFLLDSIPGANPSPGALTPRSITLTTNTTANFSSFGQLYVLLVIIDITLLLLHFYSSLEVLAWGIYPTASKFRSLGAMQCLSMIRERLTLQETDSGGSRRRRSSLLAFMSGSRDQTEVVPEQRQDPRPPDIQDRVQLLNEEFFYSFFSRSLYRNPRVVAATWISQLLSWQIVQPNSVVWTWSDSLSQKLQAYMSSIRVWVLLLLLVNSMWGIFVAAKEERAYRIVRHTYLTSVEMLGIVTVISFLMRR